jgi:hypothetical protein
MTEQTVRRLPYSSARDKAELRAQVQDSVHKMVHDRRALIWIQLTRDHPEMTEREVQLTMDQMQPEYPEFDPVVEMAVAATDHRNPPEVRGRMLIEVAQYLRPKLKSIELVPGDGDPAVDAERRALADRLVRLLDSAAAEKRTIDVTPGQPEPVGSGDAAQSGENGQDAPGGDPEKQDDHVDPE